MSLGVAGDLKRALALTECMIEAASAQNWSLVAELDEARRPCLAAMQAAHLDAGHRADLLTLERHNRMLGEMVSRARKDAEQQLEQHQYNHRALRTYVSSSSAR